MNTITDMTATDLVASARLGRLTIADIARACLERIEQRDGSTRAWAHIDPDLVMERAKALDRGPRTGGLFGVPVAVKDIIETTDMPTRHNSDFSLHERATSDAACVQMLKTAGALIIGKTQTVEFGAFQGRLPPTRNPHDLTRTPGGSSSGSAAAVADFHVPVALGTQTGGSTIRPASLCGIFGFKPTYGLVSREGIMPYAPSFDTLGWLARSIADITMLADAFHLGGHRLSPLHDMRGLRIAVCKGPFWSLAASETREVLEGTAACLADAGAIVSELKLPDYFVEFPDLHQMIMTQEGATSFLPLAVSHPETRSSPVDAHMQLLSRRDGEALRRAYAIVAGARDDFDDLAAPFDAILTPSAIGFAPVGEEQIGASNFNRVWTALHAPCVNVPIVTKPMPVGLTLVARRYEDRRLLQIADALARLLKAA